MTCPYLSHDHARLPKSLPHPPLPLPSVKPKNIKGGLSFRGSFLLFFFLLPTTIFLFFFFGVWGSWMNGHVAESQG